MSRQTYDVEIESEAGPGGRDPFLRCPICGSEWVHHESKTIVIDSGDDYKAHPKVRGNVIVIPGHCEEGCYFNILLGFRKGTTFIWAEDRNEPIKKGKK